MLDIVNSILSILGVLVIIAIIILVVLFMMIFIKNWKFRQKIKIKEAMKTTAQPPQTLTESEYSSRVAFRNDIREKWAHILTEAKAGDSKTLNLAIIKADSLVDAVLKEEGCPGEDMGERMKTFHKDDFECIDKLWEAHKVRNELAHNPNFKIEEKEARRILDLYHESMEELLEREIEMA